ncbi:2051_t:CDS:2 [Funneliformis mosseae]|uniref:2051_t:CDS:1 n=1 Tax=Funneliformis mosseae TaxID=27381 RepID=A0A9N9A1Y9_FUNMO|nr:2051_t:CDS:2 [Funneliformis mosseae]
MTKPRLSLFSLPTETLLQIISFLGSAHLKQLSLTSRSLHSLTPNYLFKTVVVYNISRFFLQKLVPKYGQHFRTLNVQGRASQEFIDQLAALLKILDDYCDRLENFNIIVLEQKPGLLEINAPCFSQSLYRYRSKSLKLTCSAQLITFLDSSDLGLLVHAVIQSVWSLNHYTEIYGSQITRARLSFEGLSDVWVLELFNNCPNLQELVLERKYLDDNIEITDATLKGLCDLSNTLKSLSFISECNSPVTEYFTPAGWKRMLIGTPNLEKLDISGLDLYFTANLLPLIAVHYRSRPLWLKLTNLLNHLPSRYKHERELMNLIVLCKNNLLSLESSYITDDVIRCLAMYSPGLIRLCLNGDLLNNRKLSLDLIEKRLVNLETFYTWNLIPEKWPNEVISYLRRASVDSQIRNRSRRVFSIKKHGQLIIIAIFFLISYYFTTQEEIK